jgi:hypothetical protein
MNFASNFLSKTNSSAIDKFDKAEEANKEAKLEEARNKLKKVKQMIKGGISFGDLGELRSLLVFIGEVLGIDFAEILQKIDNALTNGYTNNKNVDKKEFRADLDRLSLQLSAIFIQKELGAFF